MLLNIHLCTVHCLLHTNQNFLYSSYDEVLGKWIWNTLSPWILVFYQKATALACTM